MSTTRSPQELIKFVVAAGGNLPLAAERAGISKEELATMLSGNASSTLSEALRSLLVLEIYDTLMQTKIAFLQNLAFMTPNEVARAFASQITVFTQLTQIETPDLAGEVHDAAAAKEKIITRLDQWRQRERASTSAQELEGSS